MDNQYYTWFTPGGYYLPDIQQLGWIPNSTNEFLSNSKIRNLIKGLLQVLGIFLVFGVWLIILFIAVSSRANTVPYLGPFIHN